MAAVVEIEKCTGCGECVAVCPIGAIQLACPAGAEHDARSVALIDEATCSECGLCAEECPNDAIGFE